MHTAASLYLLLGEITCFNFWAWNCNAWSCDGGCMWVNVHTEELDPHNNSVDLFLCLRDGEDWWPTKYGSSFGSWRDIYQHWTVQTAYLNLHCEPCPEEPYDTCPRTNDCKLLNRYREVPEENQDDPWWR